MKDVQQHYGDVAQSILDALDNDAIVGRSSCCDAPMTAGEAAEAAFLYAQQTIAALPMGAQAASRGCGDPVAKAELQPGERVLDLGSGGGIDALIAARIVGADGRVYGVDMTPEMIELARRNAEEAGADNVEFLHGSIEDLPLPDGAVDVVLSNCVINFSDDKQRVFNEAFRVLADGGRVIVSDIVSFHAIPDEAVEPLCRIVGTTSGMSSAEEYRTMVLNAGFSQVELEPKTLYTLDVLERKAHKKGRENHFAQLADHPFVDGASGSVIIRATK